MSQAVQGKNICLVDASFCTNCRPLNVTETYAARTADVSFAGALKFRCLGKSRHLSTADGFTACSSSMLGHPSHARCLLDCLGCHIWLFHPAWERTLVRPSETTTQPLVVSSRRPRRYAGVWCVLRPSPQQPSARPCALLRITSRRMTGALKAGHFLQYAASAAPENVRATGIQ